MTGDLGGKGSKSVDVALPVKVSLVPISELTSFPGSSSIKGASVDD